MNKVEPIETIRNRLKTAMAIRGIKQIELATKTNLPKASINQYLSGYAEPKTDRIYLLAKALSVDAVWLMGFDVPMENKKVDLSEPNAEALASLMDDARFFEYIMKAKSLKAEKKEALYMYIDFLASSNTP